jgi:hypothetical protein
MGIVHEGVRTIYNIWLNSSYNGTCFRQML